MRNYFWTFECLIDVIILSERAGASMYHFGPPDCAVIVAFEAFFAVLQFCNFRSFSASYAFIRSSV